MAKKLFIQLLCPDRQEDVLIGPFSEVEMLHDGQYVVADGNIVLEREGDRWFTKDKVYFGIRIFVL